MANQAVITALAGKDAAVFSEELNHASLIDGVRLSRAATQVFAHRDYAALETMLKNCTSKNVSSSPTAFSVWMAISPIFLPCWLYVSNTMRG
jgi:8-amino-7-oxononanoate synthase